MVTFGGDCLVARRGFGCGALGLAGTCSQGSADSVGSASAAAGGRGSAVTVCRLSLTISSKCDRQPECHYCVAKC